jgi:hypothetical protein
MDAMKILYAFGVTDPITDIVVEVIPVPLVRQSECVLDEMADIVV